MIATGLPPRGASPHNAVGHSLWASSHERVDREDWREDNAKQAQGTTHTCCLLSCVRRLSDRLLKGHADPVEELFELNRVGTETVR